MTTDPGAISLYEEVCRLCDDDREGVEAIARVVNQDTRIKDLVFRSANSIQNLLPRPAQTTQHAILVLGIGRVRALVAAELERQRRQSTERTHRLDRSHVLQEPHPGSAQAADLSETH